MKVILNTCGIVGLIAIFVGLIFAAITGSMANVPAILVIIGAVLDLIWVFSNPSALRRFLAKRTTKYGTNTILMVVAVLAILVLVNTIVARHNLKWDLTEAKLHSLSPQSIKVLENLKDDVNIKCFFRKTSPDRAQVEELLFNYRAVSPKFHFEFIDPDERPEEAEAARITEYGTLFFTCGDNTEKITTYDEESITNALVKITRGVKKVVYFMKGHGEKSFDDQEENGISALKQHIQDNNYEIKEIELFREETVPQDCAVLIEAGPITDVFPKEIDLIEEYIGKGGRFLLMVDPDINTSYQGMLRGFGVNIGKDIVVDRLSRLFGTSPTVPVITTYAEHEITRKFNLASVFPMVRSITADPDLDESTITVEELAFSGPSSWAETNIDTLMNEGIAQFDEGIDVSGPISIAAITTISVDKDTKGRIAAFGDSDFITNSWLASQGNLNLFLNTVNFLAEEEDLIAIKPKDVRNQPLILSRGQASVAFWIPLILIPAFIVFVGITIIVSRRRGR